MITKYAVVWFACHFQR